MLCVPVGMCSVLSGSPEWEALLEQIKVVVVLAVVVVVSAIPTSIWYPLTLHAYNLKINKWVEEKMGMQIFILLAVFKGTFK